MSRWWCAWVVGVALLIGSCDARPAAPRPGDSTGPAAPPGALTLLVEPDYGVGPIYALIESARSSVDLTMYELVDAKAEAALVAAARRGVVVRVVLDVNREKSANLAAFDLLNTAGVHAVWADTRYLATHEKSLVIDGNLAAIMTLNLTTRYYTSTRDFAVLDRDHADIAAIDRVFVADFDHRTTSLPRGDGLIWSPGQSEPALISLIGSARHSLLIENEEMASKPVTAALVAAAHRIPVAVVMSDESDWHDAFDALTAAGARIAVYSATAALYIHAKVVIADGDAPGARAFVGSENFSAASLSGNRELGVLTADTSLIRSLSVVLEQDFAGGTRWPG